MDKSESYTFSDFVKIVEELRKKCPWDSTQTHESMKICLENETGEVLEAIDELKEDHLRDGEDLCEELGDLLFQVVLHSIIAKEEGLFSVEDVIQRVSEKMVFRHPRIFSPEDREAASLDWEELKARERSLRDSRRQ